MNHDFDIHVVNNIMKKRFIKKRDCIDNCYDSDSLADYA